MYSLLYKYTQMYNTEIHVRVPLRLCRASASMLLTENGAYIDPKPSLSLSLSFTLSLSLSLSLYSHTHTTSLSLHTHARTPTHTQYSTAGHLLQGVTAGGERRQRPRGLQDLAGMR